MQIEEEKTCQLAMRLYSLLQISMVKQGFHDFVLARGSGNIDNHFSIINSNHASNMTLHYILLFPNSDMSWHWGLELLDSRQVGKKLRLSQRVFYP